MRKLPPKEGYARYAHEYDQREKFWNSFEQDTFRPYIHASKGKRVLDAGAGSGRVTMRLQKAGADVTALDISPEMLAILKTKSGDIELVEGDMEDMPFEDDTFDMVFSSMAMVHLKKIIPFLDECYRVLKDDGIMVLLNIHYRNPLILKDDQGRYAIECYNHFPRHVIEAAEQLAFKIEKSEILTEPPSSTWMSQLIVLRK